MPTVVANFLDGLELGLEEVDTAPGTPRGSGSDQAAGEAVIAVCRVLDSPVLRETLATAASCDLAVALTDPFHRGFVRQGHPGLSGEHLSRHLIEIPGKDFEMTAWIEPRPRKVPHL
ncbi:hypothetical protein [Actinocorallia longicatena]|uniref:Uncharacterized protein n=1 Tax=Actinocorallia longicatena TaxID=111803 RepID=A0ABP6PX92_9ACTN